MDDVERESAYFALHAKLGVYYARENATLPIEIFGCYPFHTTGGGGHEQDGDGCLSG